MKMSLEAARPWKAQHLYSSTSSSPYSTHSSHSTEAARSTSSTSPLTSTRRPAGEVGEGRGSRAVGVVVEGEVARVQGLTWRQGCQRGRYTEN